MYKKASVFAAACLGLFLFGLTLTTLGSILPELKKIFDSRGLNAGILASVLPIGILAGSLVFGPIVDRYGYKPLLIVSVAISGFSMEGLAFSSSPAMLAICTFFAGFGGGIINGSTSALVSDISEKNKGANLSLLGVFFGLGALGMPLLLGFLSRRYDYETILAAAGIFIFLTLGYLAIIKFPSPKHTQGFPLREGIKLLREPVILLTGFFLFFQSGVESLINNWTTSYFREELGSSEKEALFALSFSLVGLTVTRIVLGGLLKKMSSMLVMYISLGLIILGSVMLWLSASYETAFMSLIISGIGLAAGFPVILGYVGQLYATISGTAFSIAFVIALSGNTILNFLFGVAARKNISYLPIGIIGCTVCMMILILLIRGRVRGSVKF